MNVRLFSESKGVLGKSDYNSVPVIVKKIEVSKKPSKSVAFSVQRRYIYCVKFAQHGATERTGTVSHQKEGNFTVVSQRINVGILLVLLLMCREGRWMRSLTVEAVENPQGDQNMK